MTRQVVTNIIKNKSCVLFGKFSAVVKSGFWTEASASFTGHLQG